MYGMPYNYPGVFIVVPRIGGGVVRHLARPAGGQPGLWGHTMV